MRAYKHIILNNTLIAGPDRAKFRVQNEDSGSEEPINEIEEYWNGRYLAAAEATWRILGYHITQKTHWGKGGNYPVGTW